jgi:hypothetical protein
MVEPILTNPETGMGNPILKALLRSMFVVTSRERAGRQALASLGKYQRLSDGLDARAGCLPVEVPAMPGVDEDMRRWSFFMILEHNVIVNRSISASVRQLAMGETPHGAARINPKTDVMPSASADVEQVQAFRESVEGHVEMVKCLGRLRGTRASRHPLFGEFDAHQWICMFSFHLALHYKQAAYVAEAAIRAAR